MNTQTRDVDNGPDVEIAKQIMNALIVKGSNLKALERATGISYSSLRRGLHQNRADRRSFTLREFHQIASALQVSPSTLLPDEDASRRAA
jgi:lambda repressor-like predicted transcriptional regulator